MADIGGTQLHGPCKQVKTDVESLKAVHPPVRRLAFDLLALGHVHHACGAGRHRRRYYQLPITFSSSRAPPPDVGIMSARSADAFPSPLLPTGGLIRSSEQVHTPLGRRLAAGASYDWTERISRVPRKR